MLIFTLPSACRHSTLINDLECRRLDFISSRPQQHQELSECHWVSTHAESFLWGLKQINWDLPRMTREQNSLTSFSPVESPKSQGSSRPC